MADHVADEQQRLLLHGLRRRIFEQLKQESLTAKEVAVRCGATVGNAHYHLQRLVNSGVVEAEDLVTEGGAVEKRYRPNAAARHAPEPSQPNPAAARGSDLPGADLFDAEAVIWLTVAETGQLVNELTALLHRWQSACQDPRARTQPVTFSLRLGRKPTS